MKKFLTASTSNTIKFIFIRIFPDWKMTQTPFRVKNPHNLNYVFFQNKAFMGIGLLDRKIFFFSSKSLTHFRLWWFSFSSIFSLRVPLWSWKTYPKINYRKYHRLWKFDKGHSIYWNNNKQRIRKPKLLFVRDSNLNKNDEHFNRSTYQRKTLSHYLSPWRIFE